MAQIPWEVIATQRISFVESQLMLQQCIADMRRHLPSTEHHSLILQLSQINAGLNANCPSDHFKKITAKGTIQLHPYYLNQALVGARAYLTSFLLRFVPEFKGVWLAYGKLSPLDSVGYFPEAEGWCFAVFDIQVDCLIFSPYPSSCLVGTVNQVRPGHIGLLVHNFFNAVISRDRMSPHFHFSKPTQYKHSGNKADIEENSLVKFVLVKFQYSVNGDIVSFDGSLEDGEHTGVINLEGNFVLKQI